MKPIRKMPELGSYIVVNRPAWKTYDTPAKVDCGWVYKITEKFTICYVRPDGTKGRTTGRYVYQ